MDPSALSFLITQHIVGLLSMGPCTALVIRTSLINRLSGVIVVIGAVVGSFFIKVLSVLGLAVILKKFPFLFYFVRLLGSLYLIYLGTSAIKKAYCGTETFFDLDRCQAGIKTSYSAWLSGFFVSMTNPLSSIRFIALFSTVMTADTLILTQLLYIIVLAVISLIFYLFVALFFSVPLVQNIFNRCQSILDTILGGTLIYWGFKMFQLTL